LLADSRSGGHGGVLPWALLIVGSMASLAANVAVAEPSLTGRVIAAWPSFALIGSYELLMRQIRATACASSEAVARSPSVASARLAASPSRPRLNRRHAQARAPPGMGCSSRRGSGRWRTALRTVRSRAGGLLLTVSAATNAGAGWSSGTDWLVRLTLLRNVPRRTVKLDRCVNPAAWRLSLSGSIDLADRARIGGC
jgi:hypothetical protein